jgi:hypothetical protein
MAKKKTTTKRRVQLYCLYIEDRVVHTINDVEILGPTLKQVLEAVRRLNGKNTTSINIDLGSKHLTIGGGNEGRYISFLTQVRAGKETFFNLAGSSGAASGPTIRLATGNWTSCVACRPGRWWMASWWPLMPTAVPIYRSCCAGMV